MSLFNFANLLNKSTNDIQHMVDNIEMRVQLNMKLESDVNIIEQFFTTFKPKFSYFNINLPHLVSDDKLKKLINSLAQLNTKV